MYRILLLTITATLLFCPTLLAGEPTVFERVFGIPRTLPADIVAEVKALEPGERLERDTNGDGKINEVWYLDTAFRHTVEPLLVRVVDGDGDMHETGRGDRDSDTYFWDHGANGSIDVVTDYQDDDGDGDVDQMGIFYDKDWKDDKDDITVWWAVDIGDDNRLWYDVNGNYYQQLCQWRTHFSGDELFYQFRLTEDDEKWVNVWEDPFAFYDHDGDEASETVVRISAIGDDVKNLRYSIDADDDAYGRNTHNYDFSITALPPEEGLEPDPALTAPMTIRGIETHPVLTWENTQRFAREAAWGKGMFIWDEVNSNTDGDVENDPHERWEGILNHASKFDDFPQVGGPPCSRFNKRVEVSHKPASPLMLYLDTADARIHLEGADYGYLDVDYNLDGEVDAAYSWKDTDNNGILDVRTADLDNDGRDDITQELAGNTQGVEPTFAATKDLYPALLQEVLEESQHFIETAEAALGKMPANVQEVIDFYAGPLADYHPERDIGLRIQNTPGGARLYMDLARDRMFVALRDTLGENDAWEEVEAAYLAGDIAEAADAIGGLRSDDFLKTGHTAPPFTLDGTTYDESLLVTLTNTTANPRPNTPVSISNAALRKHATNFNPDNCVVVHNDRWLAWRVVPHQVDSWVALNDGRELSFMADLPADGSKTYRVFFAEGERKHDYPKLTNAVLDNPAYVAWESDMGAFRNYTGQFDYFGKHMSRVLPREELLLYPIIDVNYHEEQPWGIDALHVNKTSGLGGLTLYMDGEPFLVQSPAGEGHVDFEYNVVGSGPVRAVAEIVATNVLPEDAPEAAVRFRCLIYAGRQESEVRAFLPEEAAGAQPAPGLQHLDEDAPFADAAAGVLGAWGRQGDDIGQIGLGVIVPPDQWQGIEQLDDERRVRCSSNGDVFRYWIIGAWRRGMQYPVAPTVENWQRDLEVLASDLNNPVEMEINVAP